MWENEIKTHRNLIAIWILINTIQPNGKFYFELNTTKKALRNMKWTLRIKWEKIQRHRRLRSDLRKRELTSLIYFILSPLNSNSLSQRENENENENEWENCTKRDGYRSLDLWAFFPGPKCLMRSRLCYPLGTLLHLTQTMGFLGSAFWAAFWRGGNNFNFF